MGQVSVTLKDGQLRVSQNAQPNQEVLVIGHTTDGTVNVAHRFTSIDALRAEFGNGEAVEAAAQLIAKCGVVRFVKCTSTAPSAPTLVESDTAPDITVTGNPSDNYRILLTTLVGGSLGTATLSFSFDNGTTTEYGTITTAASITDFAAETGLTFACASGTYVAGVTYSVTCGRPVISGANYALALAAGAAMAGPFRSVLAVGVASSIASQVTAVTSLDTGLDTLFTASTRAKRCFVEATTDSDATITSAIASTTLDRVALCLGHEYVQSVITKRVMLRSQAWSIASRAARIPNSEKIGRVRSGPIDDAISSLTRDDATTPNAATMRCCALRTREFGGVSAVYGGPAHTLAAGNSDFSLLVRAQVADEACEIFWEQAAYWLEEKLELTRETTPGAGDGGRLTAAQAEEIAADITSQLRAQLRPLVNGRPSSTAAVQDVIATVSTSNNVSTTSRLEGSVSLVPFGYSDSISFNVGFTLSA